MYKRIPWKTTHPRRIPPGHHTTTTLIGIGTNIGTHTQRLRRLHHTLHKIRNLPTTHILATSSLYETPPWGNLNQDSFYNAVIALHTHLPPHHLLRHLKQIERHLGRQPREHWGPREIDLDILQYKNLKLHTPHLTLPHPQIPHRNFVLIPLKEITHHPPPHHR